MAGIGWIGTAVNVIKTAAQTAGKYLVQGAKAVGNFAAKNAGSLISTGVSTAAQLGASAIAANAQNKAAQEAAKRQAAYQQQLIDQQNQEEQDALQLQREQRDRINAYGASLIDGNSTWDNLLSDGGYSSSLNSDSSSLLNVGITSGSSVESMFA